MKYFLLLFLLFGFQLAYFRIAGHFNIVDKPNERSSHKLKMLRGGGIVFYIGVLLFFIISKFQYPWFFFGLTLISIISFADDIKQLSPKLRMAIQFFTLLPMFYQCELFSMPWFLIIIALIVCVGILNAFNFMDGINGMTGAYSLTVIG
ncbi:MAG: UDP-GlcNAc--UDP-phosphate GlcNAc-1-phosphate transferase, partial [Paludibacter sp.]|nr:UDP-GlcNAc--UDP-phosphate GlcNAc-1-phosphate transferase [Paludibacter sp.]